MRFPRQTGGGGRIRGSRQTANLLFDMKFQKRGNLGRPPFFKKKYIHNAQFIKIKTEYENWIRIK